MRIFIVVGFLAFVILLAAAYLRQIASSRRSMERLYEGPDDLRRAGYNQQPPFDGSAGWV